MIGEPSDESPARKYYRLSPGGATTLRGAAADWARFAGNVNEIEHFVLVGAARGFSRSQASADGRTAAAGLRAMDTFDGGLTARPPGCPAGTGALEAA